MRNKAVYLALGVLPDGSRDVLGIWIEQTEGAKFWLKVFNDLKTRGVKDILIAVVDGLKGFAEAIEAAFPETTVQTCIVHLIRNSLEYATWKDRKAVAAALRPIYTAATRSGAEAALEAFDRGPGARSTRRSCESWRRAWEHVIPFFAFPPEVRRVIYTTNVIETAHAAAQDHQDPWSLPQRRGGDQADLARAAQRDEEPQPRRSRVDQRDESVRAHVPRPVHDAVAGRRWGLRPAPKSDREISNRKRRRRQTSSSSTCLSTQKS